MGKARRQVAERHMIDVGEINLREFEEREKKSQEHRSSNVKGSKLKIPEGLSKYQMRVWKRKHGQGDSDKLKEEENAHEVIPTVEVPRITPTIENLEVDPFFARKALFILKPKPYKLNILDGLYFLNYIFQNLDNQKIYRLGFSPKQEFDLGYVESNFVGKPFCVKLDNPLVIHGKRQNIYYDSERKEILVGDRYRPRENKLEFVMSANWF